MSVSKQELRRLIDLLPDREVQTVKRFIEFVLTQNSAQSLGDRPSYTVEEASPVLQLTPRRLRHLIRKGVIPAHKERGRWLINAEDLQELVTPQAREFLSHPLAKDDLTEEEKVASEEGWREHMAGKTVPLSEVMREYEHDTGKD